MVYVFAPSDRRKANAGIALIQDNIVLPQRFGVLQPTELGRLYCNSKLSIREIAKKAGVSHSTVLFHLRRCGINLRKEDVPLKRKGQVPFGWKFLNHNLVKNPDEQQIIRLMRQYMCRGESFHGIARELNRKLIPTKNNGIWQANTVKKIPERLDAKRS